MKLKYELLITIETDDKTFDIDELRNDLSIFLQENSNFVADVTDITKE